RWLPPLGRRADGEARAHRRRASGQARRRRASGQARRRRAWGQARRRRAWGSMTDPAVETAAASALELIRDGMRVGLGTGHGAAAFLARLADRVRSGLRVVGVPTSEATAAEARSLGVPLGTLDDDEDLALTVDGADEVAPNLDLVKGFGGALVRERIVAAASRRQVILVGHEKLVDRLGTRGRIPIEVVPFAGRPVLRRVRALGLEPVLRFAGGEPLISDNGNLTIDCGI